MTTDQADTKTPTHAYLKGGPCNGKTVKLSAGSWTFGFLACSGISYQVTSPLEHHGGNPVFFSTGETDTNAPPAQPKAAKLHHGWADVRRSVNHNMPAALRHARKATKAGAHALARAGKVRL